MQYHNILVLVVMFWGGAWASSVNADQTDFNAYNYDIYIGDLDDDGVEDLYVHAKENILLLHDDIATPILVREQNSFVIQGVKELIFEEDDDGLPEQFYARFFDDVTEYAHMSEDEITSLGLKRLEENTDYYFADLNGDGYKDILFSDVFSTQDSHVFNSKTSIVYGHEDADSLTVSSQVPTSHTVTGIPANAVVVDSDNDGIDELVAYGNQNVADIYYSFDTTCTAKKVLLEYQYYAGDDYGFNENIQYVDSLCVSSREESKPTTIADAAFTGSSAGKFRVSEIGAATYSMPITLPSGISGVAPSVSLNYSSDDGNGVAGMGWSLAATSSITRCRQTLYADGSAKAIRLNEDDRFCYQGQRLVLDDTSTTYGAVGARYKTEIYSGEIIISVGGALGNPDYFKVIGKDGSLKTFGFSGSHQSEIDLSYENKGNSYSGVYSWAISSSSDSAGNSINYLYSGGVENFRLAEINYADNNAKVIFNYISRDDVSRRYDIGNLWINSKRLASIAVYNSNTDLGAGVPSQNSLLRSYNLNYHRPLSNTLKYSRLDSIQECVASGCLSPVTFTWTWTADDREYTAEDIQYDFSLDDEGYIIDHQLADINGDGCSDIVYAFANENAYELRYMLANQACTEYRNERFLDGRYSYSLDLLNNGSKNQIRIIDFNADGRSDVAVKLDNDNLWEIYISESIGGGQWRLNQRSLGVVQGEEFSDVNSDGLVDLLSVEENKLYVQLAKRNDQPDTSVTAYSFKERQVVADLNTITGTSSVIEEFNNSLTCTPDYERINYSNLHTGSVGDFNGNGNIDLLIYANVLKECNDSPDDTELEAFTMTTLSLFSLESLTDGDISITHKDVHFIKIEPGEGRSIMDVNSDGLSDLVFSGSGKTHYMLSNGVGFEPSVTVHSKGSSNSLVPQLFDENNDGYLDIVIDDFEAKKKWIYLWDPKMGVFFESASERLSTAGFDSFLYADTNGDGRLDRVRFKKSRALDKGKGVAVQLNKAMGPNNLITVIDNGFGDRTEISYDNLGITEHYSRLEVDTESFITNTCDNLPESVRAMREQYGTTSGSACTNIVNYQSDDFYAKTNNPFGLSPTDKDYGRPIFEVASSMPVVTKVSSSSPTYDQANHKREVQYFYDSARIQAGGRGFLGFEALRTVDTQTGVQTTTFYSQRFPYIGMPVMTEQRSQEGVLLSAAINELSNNAPDSADYYQPYIKTSVENAFGLKSNGAEQGPIISKVTTTQSIDEHSNVINIEVKTESSADETSTNIVDYSETVNTENTYATSSISLHGQSLTYAQLGRLTESTVTKTRNGESSTNKAKFTYYNVTETLADGFYGLTGLLKTEETVTPDQDKKKVTTHFYDQFGNKTKVEVKGWNGEKEETRYSVTNYDISGRYVDSTTNALGQTFQTVIERHSLYGAPTKVRSATGIVNTTEFDALGREIYQESSLASSLGVTTRYLRCHEDKLGCPALTNHLIYTEVNNGADTVEYFDVLGRTIRKGSQSFNGQWVFIDTHYNALGLTQKISEPYFYGSSPEYWTETPEYDLLSRPLSIKAPDGSTTFIEYQNHQMVTTNALGQKKTERKTPTGDLVYVKDHLNNIITYQYDSNGNMTDTVVSSSDTNKSAHTKIVYDVLGRKISMSDPDKGDWSYQYNAFGELIEQTNANLQKVENRYDLLGRLVTRTNYTKDNTVENHSRWYFDGATDSSQATSVNAYGKTTAVIQSANINTETCTQSADYCSYNTFDSFGRAKSTTTKMATGSSAELESYTTSVEYEEGTSRVLYEYDAMHNRVLDENDQPIPSGTQNVYNAYGFVESTIDLASSSNEELYRTVSVNARGQITQSLVAGIGRTRYFNPATGRIERQVAYNGGVTDLAAPDSLAIQFIEYEWDVLGNLVSRHNQSALADQEGFRNQKEAFCYDSLNRLIVTNIGSGECGASANDQEYDGLGNLTKRNGESYSYDSAFTFGGKLYDGGIHAVTKAGSTYYNYDANGNMINDSSGRTIEYSTFDKPTRIIKGTHQETRFKYGPGRSRYMQILNGQEARTTVYLGNVERIHRGGTVEWKRYVKGGIRTYTVNSSVNADGQYELIGEPERLALFNDHLGSIDVIVNLDVLLNPIPEYRNGVIQSQSFNVWGERRNPNNYSLPTLSSSQIFDAQLREKTTRGYTGHEMLDDFGIIHMNGRIFDAKLARFLQADPFVQAPSDTQMYNRYSYLRNNPLNATDPSGYILKKIHDEYHRSAPGGRVLNYVAGKPALMTAVSIVLNFIPGCQGWCGIAVQAGFQAGTNYSRTGNLTSSFTVGAVSFASSAAFRYVGSDAFGKQFTGAVGRHLGRSFAHGMIGGIASVLQGGKFGHGFASAGLTKLANVNAIFKGMDMSGTEYDGARVIMAAIIGGTISDATGGKFANGAVTAAMGQALNANQENARENAQKRRRGNVGTQGRPGAVEGFNSFAQDIARVIFHYEALAGDHGELAKANALAADVAVTSAIGLYFDNPELSVLGENFSIYAEIYDATDVRGVVHAAVLNAWYGGSADFLIGRTAAQGSVGMYLGSRLKFGSFAANMANRGGIGGSIFMVASFGRGLNFYDAGVRNAVELSIGAIGNLPN